MKINYYCLKCMYYHRTFIFMNDFVKNIIIENLSGYYITGQSTKKYYTKMSVLNLCILRIQ